MLIFGLIAGLTLYLAFVNARGRVAIATAAVVSVLLLSASFLFGKSSTEFTSSTQFAWINFLVSAWGFGFAVLQILELNSQLTRFRTRSMTLTYPRQLRASLPQFLPLATPHVLTKDNLKRSIENLADIHEATREALEVEDFLANQRKTLKDLEITLAAILDELRRLHAAAAGNVSIPKNLSERCEEAGIVIQGLLPK